MLLVPVMRHTSEMTPSETLYHRHRFPHEIISHCVWLYFRFSLSFRDVEEILAMRGSDSHLRNCSRMVPEVRPGLCQQPAPQVPASRRPLAPGRDFLKINGRPHYR